MRAFALGLLLLAACEPPVTELSERELWVKLPADAERDPSATLHQFGDLPLPEPGCAVGVASAIVPADRDSRRPSESCSQRNRRVRKEIETHLPLASDTLQVAEFGFVLGSHGGGIGYVDGNETDHLRVVHLMYQADRGSEIPCATEERIELLAMDCSLVRRMSARLCERIEGWSSWHPFFCP